VTLARFLAGIPLSLIAFVPVVLMARTARRLLLPKWRGVEARLAETVLALVAITVVSELLGTVGWFAPLPLTAGLAVTGSAFWLATRGRLDETTASTTAYTGDNEAELAQTGAWRTTIPAVAWSGIFLVVGSWLARTLGSIARGMTTVDTLWYHLPVAVRFVQTGSLRSIQYLDTEPVTAYFPATSSLYHAIGILLFRTDLVSTVVNIAWLALAVAAAWCIGRRFSVAPATALAAALVLGTPGLVATQPGGAYNDVAGVALLLTAFAIAVRPPDEPRSIAQDVVAALAAGLALGIKFTFVVPAAALCLGLVWTAPRGVRIRRAVAVSLAAALAGGYWYVRNAAATGNPLPSLSLHLGPFALPSVKGATPTSTVARFLFDGSAWRENFLPGLRSSLGPAWIAVVVLALVGMVTAAARRSEPRLQMLGVIGLVSTAGWVFTPQYLVGGFGRPLYFGANLRYATPALAIGLVLFPIVLARWRTWVFGALALAVVVTQLDPTSWPTGVPWAVFQDRVSGTDTARALAVLIVAGLLAFGACTLIRRDRVSRSGVALSGLLIPLTVLVALAFVHGSYLEHRYADTSPFPNIFAFARNIRDARIAVAGGYMQAQYPLAGLDLTDYVQFAGVRTSGGGWRPVRNCAEWVKFLEAGHYDYVVIGPGAGLTEWTRAQSDARLVRTQTLGGDVPVVRIFRLDAHRSPRTCG
jgi:hypothetical protein